MQITQTSNRAVMDWSSFSILKGEAVNISQPSSRSALLNRVVGNSASEIYGSLTANGQVFLINPNGILFGQGASVNVGGLVASSLDISDDNFMNAALTFYNDGAAGSVVNQGGINAGFAALLGRRLTPAAASSPAKAQPHLAPPTPSPLTSTPTV